MVSSAIESRLNAFDAIYERRSVRTFDKGRNIPDDILSKIIDSARYAPTTPDGIHPWRVVVCRDETTKALFAECGQEMARKTFGGSFEVFSQHIWYMPPDTRMRVAEYTTSGELWRYAEDADVVLVPGISRGGWCGGLAGLLTTSELLAPYLGMASQNMWITGAVFGVGAGYNAMTCVDVRRRQLVAQHLGSTHSWDLEGAFAFGYSPGLRASGPSRGPLEAIVFSERWGAPYERAAFRNAASGIKMPEANIFHCMKNLNLVKNFKPGKVDDWQVERVVDSAVWGPDPENVKHWRYLVVRNPDSKRFLNDLVSEKKHIAFYFNDFEAQAARLWYVKEEDRMAKVEQVMEEGLGQWYRTADTMIIVVAAGHNWLETPYMQQTTAGANPVFELATGCSAQNMMLAATALGLGVHFDPTPVSDTRTKELLHEYFGIPHAWHPIGVLCLGEAGDKLERRPPPPAESLFFQEYWGNPLPSLGYSI